MNLARASELVGLARNYFAPTGAVLVVNSVLEFGVPSSSLANCNGFNGR